MSLDELRLDISIRQKREIHFIVASVVIWSAVFTVQMMEIPMLTKNLLTFCCTAPLLPLAYLVSRIMHIDFSGKGNPLTRIGVMFSVNQMLYLLIAMWVFSAMPDKMVMVIAIIFGAHLLPYSWLYQSRSYAVFSLLISIGSLALGLIAGPAALSAIMIGTEVLFCTSLFLENNRMAASALKAYE